MGDVLIVLLVIAAAVGIGVAIWALLRHRYVQSLRERGWTFITSPDISIVHQLNVPPFGVGFRRSVDDQIVGAAPDGTPFSAFRYKSSNWSSAGYVVAMPLGRSLPAGEVASLSGPRMAIAGHTFSHGQARATAPDGGYAQQLLAAMGPVLRGPWRVTVDHHNLILIDAPKDAESLAAAVAELAELRTSLLNSPAAQLQGPTPPPGLSFYERPWWNYLARDDSYLQLISHSRGGSHHTASDIIFSDNAGLPFIRLRHEWQTTRTVTDSEGRTRTETDHHSEELCEFRITVPFRPISVNWGWFGKSQTFELEAFNERVKVRAPDERFASHVIHQRQMEYLLRLGAPSFSVEGDGRVLVGDSGDWLPADIDRADHLLRGFFANVPDFVWKDLGAWPRPIPELEAH